MLQIDHVGVLVMRKLRAQAVAGLCRLAVSDIVWKHDEVFAGIQQLARPEELSSKVRSNELLARSAGAVQNHHRIGHVTGAIFLWRSEAGVVDLDLGQRLAGLELVVLDGEVALVRRRGLLGDRKNGE